MKKILFRFGVDFKDKVNRSFKLVKDEFWSLLDVDKILNSSSVVLDPDNVLPEQMAKKFVDLHRQYDHVFNDKISRYNGFSGSIEGNVNMGRVLPPQRKARIPQYSREKLNLLQNKFDELEREGVFAKPEDMGITAEYLNMSFLVPKPSN